jgi:hypothetical protein
VERCLACEADLVQGRGAPPLRSCERGRGVTVSDRIGLASEAALHGFSA